MTYRKNNSELLATSVRLDVDSERKIDLSIETESTHPGPHSGRQWAHGNCDANEAKK